MSIAERRDLIAKIEALRGSKLICYLTSIRPNADLGGCLVRCRLQFGCGIGPLSVDEISCPRMLAHRLIVG